MTLRTSIVRRHVAALVACSVIVTAMPFSATAEYGIPAGSSAVVTAGQSLLVRTTPGWDAPVSYEIADGSSVTVWDVAQAAPDGSMWYPVDGGFIPADGITSTATLEGGFQYFQEGTSQEWVEPAATQGYVDPNTGQWVDPAAQDYVDPNTGEWVEPTASQTDWVEPNTSAPVEPAATQGWVDPNTGVWIDPTAVQGYIDPNTGTWVDPAAGGYVHPTTGEWVQTVSLAQEATTEEWVEPAAEETWTEPMAASEETWTEPVDAASQEWVEPAPVAASTSGDAWGEPIGTAYIAGTRGDGVACRVAAEPGSEKLAILSEGEAVEVRGEAIGEWQPVNCAGMGGYINTAYIAWEPSSASLVELEQRRRNRGRSGTGNGNSGGGAGNDGTASASGQQIANFAMQYEGYPYIYAGEGPYAFDCSGFTKFVLQNTLGIDITHDMFAQYDMGQQVAREELQPGDLVFFQNTFRPGMSHNGIYIGNGQMIHAENESTGVKVSDLNSDYYSSRWYGAVRIS